MGPEGTLTLSWLIRLRWAAVAVYGLLITWAWLGLGLELPMGLLGSLLLVVIASNLGLQAWWDAEGPGPRALTGSVLALDILVLGGLLYGAGGPANPCSSLFLVHVALAASVLGSRWGWAMALMAMSVYALLFPFHLPLGHLDHAMGGMAWHLWGMWAGMAAASALVAHFVGRLADALSDQRHLAEALRSRLEREARLASITSLAAGAAHELATPLGTIAIAASDMELGDPASMAEDVALIRAEVARCRAILDALAFEGGHLMEEEAETLNLAPWAEAVLDSLGPRVELRVEPVRLRVPPKGLACVLRAVLKNACEASAPEQPIALQGRRDATGGYQLIVMDEGRGIPQEQLRRIGEPFFTTKGEEGLGLGLHLARSFVERLGGRVEVVPQPKGTWVTLIFPAGVVS